LAQHHFSSKSEADDFIAQHMEGINYQAKPDFHGLSSDRMRRLLAAEELDGLEDMVELNDHLPVEQTRTAWLPSIAAHILNLHRAAPKGVGLTSTGNYKPAVVHAVWEHFYPDADKGRAPRNEDQFRELRLVHDFLAERYFTEENTTTSRLSGEGRILAEEPDPNRLWRELFEYMLYTYDWQEPVMEILAFPEHRFIQESGLFSLLLLRDMAKDFIGISEAYKEFTVAFPYQTNGLRQAGQFNSFNIYLFMYKHLFVDNFCADLGLIEYETPFPRGQLPTPPERFRASSLLNQVLRWKI
jgi:hypothetical protein